MSNSPAVPNACKCPTCCPTYLSFFFPPTCLFAELLKLIKIPTPFPVISSGTTSLTCRGYHFLFCTFPVFCNLVLVFLIALEAATLWWSHMLDTCNSRWCIYNTIEEWNSNAFSNLILTKWQWQKFMHILRFQSLNIQQNGVNMRGHYSGTGHSVGDPFPKALCCICGELFSCTERWTWLSNRMTTISPATGCGMGQEGHCHRASSTIDISWEWNLKSISQDKDVRTESNNYRNNSISIGVALAGMVGQPLFWVLGGQDYSAAFDIHLKG